MPVLDRYVYFYAIKLINLEDNTQLQTITMFSQFVEKYVC
jgi:hypothetical protein